MGLARDILAIAFEDTDLWPPILIALAIVGGIGAVFRYLLKKRYPTYIVMSTASVCVGLVILEFNLWFDNSITLHTVSGLLVACPVAVCMWKYLSMQKNLKKVKFLAEPNTIDFDIVGAWELLQSLSPKMMFPRQRRRHQRYRLFLLINLGNISAVDANIDEFKGDKAYYHLLQHVKYLSMGKIANAASEIKMAEEACTADTESHTYVQILSNRGTSHVGMRNFRVADDYFYKAIQSYKTHKLRDRELLGVLYYNYAFNKTRLGDDVWKDVLEAYKSRLNPRNANDCIQYFNTRMEILRQTNADRSTIGELVQQSYIQIMSLDFPIENQCIFASSVAKIVWSARIDPSSCLETLTDNLETLANLPMPARYNTFQNIDLLFMDLHGRVAEEHFRLREKARDYMLNQAEKDLEFYRKNLPEEAVREKCFCYMELAGLQKRLSQDYDFNRVSSYLNNAIDLYHENALFIDEHVCRMAILDELCGMENLDEDYRLTKPEEMRHQLAEIEAFLPSLKEHPSLAEFRLRLSFYCLHLDDYDKCATYYREFTGTPVSLEHFAPWLHRYHTVTSFCVRAIHFMRAIEKVKESLKPIYEPEIQEWFRTYPNHDGMLDSMLLGRFLGYREEVPLKLKVWIDPKLKNGSSPRGHMWLWLDVLDLSIDITYAQFTDDKHSKCVFFSKDRHPFETNKSHKIIADGIATGLHFKGAMLRLSSERDLSPVQQRLFDNLHSIIASQVDVSCPSLERISELYVDTMLPVPASPRRAAAQAGAPSQY